MDNYWHDSCMTKVGTCFACVQHSCQVQSWHGFCMGCNICANIGSGTSIARVQHLCQHWKWHEYCVCCNIRANTRRAQSWHESCMVCNMRASVQVGMGIAWGKLGFTSVWAYVGPSSDKHNTRTARENKSKIKFKKVLTQEQKAI